jgi:hypothetical protein
MTELRSARCRFCGARLIVAPGNDRESQRRFHESVCDLSVDCGYCAANAGQPCKSSSGKTVRHQSRKAVL